MARIVSIGTAVPPFCFSQEQVRESARQHFRGKIDEVERLIRIFDNVQVDRRFFCVPLEWLAREHTFTEKNEEYKRWAEKLSVEAVERCLQGTGIGPKEVAHIVFVSTSGLSTPSIDAHLVNNLGFHHHVRRSPIFGLGCAGGASGFSLCSRLARAAPDEYILLISVELSSLTFQPGDFRKANFVASALFSDGAAAALICGDNCSGQGATVIDTLSTLWPDTLDLMGWDFSEEGLRVILSRDLPVAIRRHIRGNIEEILKRNQVALEGLSHYAIHPGGAKILLTLQESLQIPPDRLRPSSFILQNYGNMSSPTVFFVLDHLIRHDSPRRADYCLCAAFGPGFSSELILLRW